MQLYKGIFEAHITLAPLKANEAARFVQFCSENDLKPVQIELSRGTHALQQMTSSTHEGVYEEVLQEIQQIADNLRQAGFTVTRVKLEASPFNEGLPITCADLPQHPAEHYFEHHLKLLLPADIGKMQEILVQTCEAHKAHLSRNAFKKREDGMAERFVTLRNYGLGRQEAEQARQTLAQDIEKNGFQILKTITEYCVYDDHVALDANWLTVDEYQTPCEVCNNACILNPV